MWKAKPTGDMTLSVVDDAGFQVLKVDMLAYGTMKAGDHGDRLARALNDLSVLASFGNDDYSIDMESLPYPEAGLSPMPWKCIKQDDKRRIVVCDMNGKKIAERTYPRKTRDDFIADVFQKLSSGCEYISI